MGTSERRGESGTICVGFGAFEMSFVPFRGIDSQSKVVEAMLRIEGRIGTIWRRTMQFGTVCDGFGSIAMNLESS